MNVTEVCANPTYPPEVKIEQPARWRFRQDQLAVLSVVAASIIWGSSFAFGKVALQSLAVSQIVLIRFAIGSAALLPLLVLRRVRIQPRDWLRVLSIGFMAVPATFLIQYRGLALTTISRASLIIGAAPPLMALGGFIFFRERPSWRTWIAVGLSIVGIGLVSGSPGEGGSLLGDGLVFVSILVSVSWVLMSKSMFDRYGALALTSYILVAGTVTLLPFTYFMDGLPPLDLDFSVWASLIMLGLFCTALTFILWNWGLERLPASKAGVYLNLEPLVGVALGVAIWGESIGASVILGGALVLLAELDVARSQNRE